jgi:hypothetical protein
LLQQANFHRGFAPFVRLLSQNSRIVENCFADDRLIRNADEGTFVGSHAKVASCIATNHTFATTSKSDQGCQSQYKPVVTCHELALAALTSQVFA